jgi:hypothetical protein
MVEQAPYKVVRMLEKVEIREYPETLLATVSGRDDGAAFSLLFNYIAGNNSSRAKLPMTAPVVSSERRPEKIPMTAPVVSSIQPPAEKIPMTAPVVSGDGFFTFVMPSSYTAETIPAPLDSRVRIHVQAPKTFAVLKFSGRANRTMVERRTAELMSTLSKNGIITRNYAFLMRYNSPFTPGFMRRNEIGVELA